MPEEKKVKSIKELLKFGKKIIVEMFSKQRGINQKKKKEKIYKKKLETLQYKASKRVKSVKLGPKAWMEYIKVSVGKMAKKSEKKLDKKAKAVLKEIRRAKRGKQL